MLFKQGSPELGRWEKRPLVSQVTPLAHIHLKMQISVTSVPAVEMVTDAVFVLLLRLQGSSLLPKPRPCYPTAAGLKRRSKATN